jgi:hypothetical protein
MAVCQNLVPLVNIKIAGKWMFIPLKMVLICIDPYPYGMMPQFLVILNYMGLKKEREAARIPLGAALAESSPSVQAHAVLPGRKTAGLGLGPLKLMDRDIYIYMCVCDRHMMDI